MFDVYRVADEAEVIVNGFAVLRCPEGLRVANLNTGRGVAIFMDDGLLVETNMDDIELAIARDVLNDALTYLAA